MATAEELRQKYLQGSPLQTPTRTGTSTPVTDKLRQQFSSVKIPQAPKPTVTASVPAPSTTGSSTPLTDALRSRFLAPQATSTPSPIQGFQDEAQRRVEQFEANKSPFVKNLEKVTSDLISAGGKAISGFVASEAERAKQGFTGGLAPEGSKNPIKDSIAKWYGDSLWKSAQGLGYLARGFNEGVFRIAKSGYETVAGTPKEEPSDVKKTTILDEFTKDVTGRDKIFSYQQEYPRIRAEAKQLQATDKEADTFAGIAVLGMIFMDNPLFGGAGKPVVTLSKESIERLAKEETDDIIRDIVKAENPNLPSEAIEFLTPAFKNAKTPQQVEELVRVANETAARAKTAGKPAKEGAEAGTKVVDEAVEPALKTTEREVAQAIPEEGGATTRAFLQDSPLDDAARTSLNDVYKDAQRSLDVDENLIEDLPEGITGRDAISRIVNSTGGTDQYDFLEKVSDTLKSLGYRDITRGGADIPTEQVLNGSKLPTPVSADEVLSTYMRTPTEAVGDTPPPLPGAMARADRGKGPIYTPSVNLLKEVASTDDKFDMLKIVEREFPRIPDKVKNTFVERLTSTARTDDIESILRNANELNLSGAPFRATTREKAVLEGSLPPTVRQLMTDKEKMAYIRTITRKIDDKADEMAVVAESEYNRIVDEIDQKAIDRFNGLKIEIEYMEDALAGDPAGDLFRKYYRGRDPSDPTMELQELAEKAITRSRERSDYRRGLGRRKPKPLTKREENLLGVYEEVEALGFKDLDDAWEAIQRYQKSKKRIEDIKAEVKEMAPYIRSAEILRGALDVLPLVEDATAREIDKLTTYTPVTGTYRDIFSTNIGGRDVYRNFQRFFREKYPEVKKIFLDPLDKGKGQFVDEVTTGGDRLASNVVEKLKIQRGGKESEWIQRYGDTDLPEGERRSFDDLVNEFGEDRAAELVQAHDFFRGEYDKFIDRVNEVRRKIYPNDPSKLVSKQGNYYRHFRELGDEFGDVLRAFFDTPAGIDPKLVGVSEWTAPRSRFLPFQQTRKGQATDLDAVGGFIDYLPMFSYAVHIDPHISKFRYLRRKLADVAPIRGSKIPVVDQNGIPVQGSTETYNGIENMLTFLNHFANDLSGKTNPLDRFIQERVPGGRATMRALDFVNNRIKANQILGNQGTGIAQLANLPLGLSSAGPQNFARGMARTLASITDPTGPASKSIFLKERYLESLKDRFPISFADRPVKRSTEEARKALGWVLKTLDRVGTDTIWHAKYEQFLSKNKGANPEDAIKFADDETRKLVAGRGIGEVPLDQKSRVGQTAMAFTLEVENFWHVLDDNTREYFKGSGNRNLTMIATLLLANYAYNEFSERTRGSRVVYDPINAAIDGWQIAASEMEAGRPESAIVKALGRQVGEFLSNKALGTGIAATLIKDEQRKDLFGEQDPTRFGSGLLVPEAIGNILSASAKSYQEGTIEPLAKALLAVAPPFAGKQIEKSWTAIQAMLRGDVTDKQGRYSFPVEQSLGNWIKAVLFGQYATEEAREYFDTRSDLFRVIDQQEIESQDLGMRGEKEYRRIKEIADSQGQEAAQAAFKELNTNDKALGAEVASIADAKKLGLTGNERLIKMLHVENGERAKYIAEQLQSMNDSKKKTEYWTNLVEKEILTPKVAKQVKYLLSVDF